MRIVCAEERRQVGTSPESKQPGCNRRDGRTAKIYKKNTEDGRPRSIKTGAWAGEMKDCGTVGLWNQGRGGTDAQAGKTDRQTDRQCLVKADIQRAERGSMES